MEKNYPECTIALQDHFHVYVSECYRIERVRTEEGPVRIDLVRENVSTKTIKKCYTFIGEEPRR